ncbi:MAG: FAD-dependent monooxygenase [Planctomycetia bacterium]|nr:FAD-dependent monooxygenase [Planctomycetia bacterium]
MSTDAGVQFVDTLVVGAGPVGLTMSAELARHGVPYRVIDKAAAPTDKSKALVLWSRSLEMLDDMGTVASFLAAGRPVHAVTMASGTKRLAHIEFEIDSPFDYGLMIPQSETERLLTAHLAAGGHRVERQIELVQFTADAEGVTSTLRTADGREQTVRSLWLVGCDGAHSAVRHGLGIEFSGDAEPNDWMLADVHIHGPVADDEVTIYFHQDGVLAFFPITSDRFRVIADLGAAKNTARPADPTLEDVKRLVDARGPGGITVSDPVWLAGFRINERKVDDYRHGRVFLAGDAAHIHSPAGGQGMNTGMQDAYNLAWKLALVDAGRAKDLLLDSYSIERSAVGDQVLRDAGFLTRAATLRNPVAQQLRNHLYLFLGSLGAVRQRISDTLSEMAINYRKSPLTGERSSLGAHAWQLGVGVAAGDRAPDVPLVDAATDQPVRLFDVFRGTRHVLVLLPGVEPAADVAPLVEMQAAIEARYPGVIASHVVARGRGPGVTYLDSDLAMHKRYGAGARTLYLIRPDGYVGYRSQPAELAGLLAHLDEYLV